MNVLFLGGIFFGLSVITLWVLFLAVQGIIEEFVRGNIINVIVLSALLIMVISSIGLVISAAKYGN